MITDTQAVRVARERCAASSLGCAASLGVPHTIGSLPAYVHNHTRSGAVGGPVEQKTNQQQSSLQHDSMKYIVLPHIYNYTMNTHHEH